MAERKVAPPPPPPEPVAVIENGVIRSLTGEVVVATTGAAARTYNVGNLATGTTYDFQIIATNAIGNSARSNIVTATTGLGPSPSPSPSPPPGQPPPAPTNLGVADIGDGYVALTWTDVVGEDGYNVYLGTDTSFPLTSVTAPSVTVTSLNNGQQYTFTVRSFNTYGESAASPPAYATPGPVQSPPPPPPGSKFLRDGSWWETPLPDLIPIHGSNDTFIANMDADPVKYNGLAYPMLMGGSDHAYGSASDGSVPIYRVTTSTPNYHIVADPAVVWLDPRFAAGGEGIRIPAAAKTYFASTATTKSSIIIFDPNRGYYATFPSQLVWEAGGTPVAGDADTTGRWYLQSGGTSGITFASSYGITSGTTDPATSAKPASWPTRLRTSGGVGTGVDPATYQDNPENYGPQSGFPASNLPIDYDRLTNDQGMFYVPLILAWTTNIGYRFPLQSGMDYGGAVPIGARLRIKPSIDVAAVLAADTSTYGVAGARTTAQTTALQQATWIARGLQRYGCVVGGRSAGGGQSRLRLEARPKEGKTVGWAMPEAGLRSLPFATSWEFVADDYDPGVNPSPSPSPSPPPGTVPAAPTTLTVIQVGDSVVALDWSDAVAPSNAPVTSYQVYSGTATTNLLATTDGITTSATITGLTNGQGYTFTVRATNTYGQSGPSPSAQATPASLPTVAPTGVTQTGSTNNSVSMSWNAVANPSTAPILGYRVYISGGPGAPVASVTTLSATVSNLAPGGAYPMVVAAYNRIGEGPSSSPITMTTTGQSSPPPPPSPSPPPGDFALWETDSPISTTGPLPAAPTNLNIGAF